MVDYDIADVVYAAFYKYNRNYGIILNIIFTIGKGEWYETKTKDELAADGMPDMDAWCYVNGDSVEGGNFTGWRL